MDERAFTLTREQLAEVARPILDKAILDSQTELMRLVCEWLRGPEAFAIVNESVMSSRHSIAEAQEGLAGWLERHWLDPKLREVDRG